MIQRLKNDFPNFSHLEESSLKSEELATSWQVSALDDQGRPLGSGFSKQLSIARKVAIAEFIERNFVLRLKTSDEGPQWMLNSHPTSCGFAAGFDPLSTKIRSIGEGLERWALAQWLDEGYHLEEEMAPLWPTECLPLLRDFNDVSVFKKDFLYEAENRIIPYQLCVTVAWTQKGAFLGSAVRSSFEEALSHAMVESHRHLLISTQKRNFNIFPYNRIKYFAHHRKEALDIISFDGKATWPTPIVEFQKDYINELFCISRTIFKDWTPWERGALNRMLY